MKTIEQFEELWRQQFSSESAALEQLRRRAQVRLAAVAAVLGCMAAALIYLFMPQQYRWESKATAIAAASAAVVVAFVTLVIHKSVTKDFRMAFKLSLMCKLGAFWGMQHEPGRCVSGGLFTMANMFRERTERYSGEDYLAGKAADCQVEFSNVTAEYVVRQRGGLKNYGIQFRGLLYSADFNRPFAGQTLVLPDMAQAVLGKLGQVMQSIGAPVGALVRCDDAQFEKYFVVYSENEQEARRLLSAPLMAKLTEYRKTSGLSLRLSFTGTRMFIAVHFSRPPIEPRLFGSMLNEGRLRKYFGAVSFAMQVNEILSSSGWAAEQPTASGQVVDAVLL